MRTLVRLAGPMGAGAVLFGLTAAGVAGVAAVWSQFATCIPL